MLHLAGCQPGIRPGLLGSQRTTTREEANGGTDLKYVAPLQEFKGYVFKIMGGQDKQGFPMKQGVLVSGRVQLLMKPGDTCFRGFGRRKGERRRKSVRGCIVSQDLSVLNLAIVKQGGVA